MHIEKTFFADIKAILGKARHGLILCSDKDETIVKYSILKENKQLFASKYQLFLPDEKQLAEEIEKERQRICTNL